MIRRFFDLSLRHKIPIWGAALIIFSSLSVSGVMTYRAYSDLKMALVASSSGLGLTLARTLVPPLLQDDVWRAYELVRAPFTNTLSNSGIYPDAIIVVSKDEQVIVSSAPEQFPMLSPVSSLGSDFQSLNRVLGDHEINRSPQVVEPVGSAYIYIAVPIQDGSLFLAHLILRHPRSSLNTNFKQAVMSGGLLGIAVLAILLPINWYWGQRMTVPLTYLASRMENIGNGIPERLKPDIYNYDDELGRMFTAYNSMVDVLEDKAALEKEMISAERLTAIGRLTAGMAHEINNPLLGMLTALDTLKRRGGLDERTLKTLGLIERGLLQIRDTVGALLIESRSGRRQLEAHDMQDVYTLLHHEIEKRHINFEFNSEIDRELPLPASAVRQILINLLQNALQAASKIDNGWINVAVKVRGSDLHFNVANNGKTISREQMAHLYEPFVSFQNTGHGLGLWVTYQLVSQLGGIIHVNSRDGRTEFSVSLPLTGQLSA